MSTDLYLWYVQGDSACPPLGGGRLRCKPPCARIRQEKASGARSQGRNKNKDNFVLRLSVKVVRTAVRQFAASADDLDAKKRCLDYICTSRVSPFSSRSGSEKKIRAMHTRQIGLVLRLQFQRPTLHTIQVFRRLTAPRSMTLSHDDVAFVGCVGVLVCRCGDSSCSLDHFQ